MMILAIDTYSKVGSVAIFDSEKDGNEPPYQITFGNKIGTAAEFATAIQQVQKDCHVEPGSIETIGVTTGPGSFTGLRIGVTAAKILAMTWNAKLVGVNTLAAIGQKAVTNQGLDQAEIVCAIDAQRKQLFSATFRVSGGQIEETSATRIWDRDEWIASIPDSAFLAGAGAKPIAPRIENERPDVKILSHWFEEPNSTETALAPAIAQISHQQTGPLQVDPFQLVPNYFRKSAAEEKLDVG